jgi:hypothetical protein
METNEKKIAPVKDLMEDFPIVLSARRLSVCLPYVRTSSFALQDSRCFGVFESEPHDSIDYTHH